MEMPSKFEQQSNLYDATIIGAGFAGLYMLHRLKKAGLKVKVFEAGTGVGGTWYWNRYPGARCDVESWEYSYGFSEELEQEWNWTERYAGQPEILSYLEHVAKKFDLYENIDFSTRVESAILDNSQKSWTLKTDASETLYKSKFCIMATGCLSSANVPYIEGFKQYEGDWFHTGNWPHEKIDFTNKVVGIIGTGSSSIQATPIIGEEARHLYVFQRTPNWSVPARNTPLKKSALDRIKESYQSLRKAQRQLPLAAQKPPNRQSALDVSMAERKNTYDRFWEIGGLSFLGAFKDIATSAEANETAKNYLKEKIQQTVQDETLIRKLIPEHYLGCKRPCSDTGYYSTFNRENVSLVDAREEPIVSFSKKGIVTSSKEYLLDAVIFATGFDAMTGSLDKIDIRGRNNVALKQKWEAGPKTYLGLGTSGFPNLFIIAGPGSPSVLANMVVGIEHHVDWIGDCIQYLKDNDLSQIDIDPVAEEEWVRHVNQMANRTLYTACNNWYLGANIPGKPRVFMPYIGGFPKYERKCEQVVREGYAGFKLS